MSYANFDFLSIINDFVQLNIFHDVCECKKTMKICKRSAAIDGYYFVCLCGKTKNIRKGSWLEKSHLSLSQVFIVINLWSKNCELQTVEKLASISSKTASKLNKFLYEVVLSMAEANSEPIGGKGKIVEIDESKFGRRKYNKGHKVDGVWVFGGVERDSRRSFMAAVDKRDELTLIPLIRKWIHPDTTIISDCWAAYRKLEQYGYKHLTVNHSENFVDPTTGAHSNTVELYWCHVKKYLPSYNRRRKYFPCYLAKFVVIRNLKSDGKDVVKEILKGSSKFTSM